MQNIKHYDITPDVPKLLRTVLPSLGHTSVTAFNDLLDNSLDAEASEITVYINSVAKGKSESYVIVDNGVGMNKETLIESFRFATDIGHNERDLGKFGIGGTTSIFSLGEEVVKITRCKSGEILVGHLDISLNAQLNNNQPLAIRKPKKKEKDLFETATKGGTGTMIWIKKLRAKEYSQAYHLANKLVKEFAKTFHQRIQCGVVIKVGDQTRGTRVVVPNDPMLRNDPNGKVKSSYCEQIEYKGSIINLYFTELDISKTEQKERSMADQGLYFNRNDRLIVSGVSWSPLWNKHNSLNCGRVEISFNDDLDLDFSVGALKDKVNLSQSLVDLLKPSIAKFIMQVRKSNSENTMSPKDVADLLKEDDMFNKQLKSKAVVLEMPKSYKASSHRGPNNPNSTQKERKKNESKDPKPRRGTIVPKWEYVHEPRTNQPFWFYFQEGEMVITVNLKNSFIEENYTNDNSKMIIKKVMAAHCISAYNLKMLADNDSVAENIQIFLDKFSEKLGSINDNIK